jgi:hydroxymethylbilane synthase
MKKLRIGTRGSQLALWQAHFTQQALLTVNIESELVIIKTKGDIIQHLSFQKMEGKGFFTKEIEDALLQGEIDLAVHSMKDLPTQSQNGLVISAVSHREDPSDCIIAHPHAINPNLPFKLKLNANIGSSSARRKAQMTHFRSDIFMRDLRGNVPTRIQKLETDNLDAIIIALAGVKRLQLDLSKFVMVPLDPREFVPAPAQGVLAWQTNADDITTRTILKKIHNTAVATLTNIERRVLQIMDGGCQLPLGVYCTRDNNGYFHATASCLINQSMRRVNYSSGTYLGMAEKIVEHLHR